MPAQLTILSGKGGTGKTTVAASFLNLAGSVVAADCDVDAPNLHLLLDPTLVSREPFEGAMVARIDPEKCTKCNLCAESCPFGAIKDLVPATCPGRRNDHIFCAFPDFREEHQFPDLHRNIIMLFLITE